MQGCPTIAELEALAAGRGSDSVREHVSTCASCAEHTQQIERDNAFLAEVSRHTSSVGDMEHGAAFLGTSTDAPGRTPSSGALESISGYDIRRVIGRGGQAVVYEAWQHSTQRRVALKVMLYGSSGGLVRGARFAHEIHVVAQLRHPAIVTVFDSGTTTDGRPYFAMEYVDGEPIHAWVIRTTRELGRTFASVRSTLELFIKVCDAVDYAHKHGIIHRDLKPSNILVDAAGDPHVVDFGISRSIVSARTHTMTGEFIGTLAYAAPEQVRGSPDLINTRSDVYSLGVMLYELLTGIMPYDVDGPVGEVARHIELSQPRQPSKSGVRLGADLQTILLTALMKEPDRRYQSAQRLADDLRRFLAGDAIEARRASGWYLLRKTSRRYWPALVAAGLFVILLTTFAVTSRMHAARLGVLLSESRLERARSMLERDEYVAAESVLWRNLFETPGGHDAWDPGDDRLPISRTWWGLWELYSAQPCARTVRVSTTQVNVLLPSGVERIVWADAAGGIGLRSTRDLTSVREVAADVRPNSDGPFPGQGIRFATIRKDGSIVVARYDGEIARLDATTLRPLGPEPAERIPIEFSSSFSADGTNIVTGDANEIRVVSLTEGAILARTAYTSQASNPRAVFSADGKWLLCADRVGWSVRRVDDLQSGRLVHFDPVEMRSSFPVATGPGPRWIFAAGPHLYDMDGDVGTMRLIGIMERVSRSGALYVSADGSLCAAAGEDNRVSVWDTRAGVESRAMLYLEGHARAVMRTLFIHDNTSLLSSDDAGVVKMWDLPGSSGRGALRRYRGHHDSIFAIAVSRTGDRVFTASEDGTIGSWNLDTADSSHSEPLGGSVQSLAISSDGRTIVGAIKVVSQSDGVRGDLVYLDANTLAVTRRIIGAHPHKRCSDVVFAPSGVLASTGDDGFVQLWIAGDQHPRRLQGRPPDISTKDQRSVQFSADGQWIAWGGTGFVALAPADLSTPPRFFRTRQNDIVRCVRFSHDSRRLAAAGNDFGIRIWNVADGKPLATLQGHRSVVYGLAWSPDDRMLASCSGDQTVRLWDPARGHVLSVLRDRPENSPSSYFAVSFTPSGRHLVVGGSRGPASPTAPSGTPDGYLGVWDLRAFDRHIAGNLEFWADELRDDGVHASAAARAWARSLLGRDDDR